MDNIIIKKFGGTSLTDLNRVANLIKRDVERGCNVIVVVSAVAGFTDQLAFQARQISDLSCKRELSEYDVILSAGEQISCGMLAITLQSIGINAKSWLAWQLPIITDDLYSESKIKTIEIDHLKRSFAEGYTVAIIAGFQGIHDDRITTFGRGGSDISAVALAVAFNVRVARFSLISMEYIRLIRKLFQKHANSNLSPTMKCWKYRHLVLKYYIIVQYSLQ